jgi:hypothetical protein
MQVLSSSFQVRSGAERAPEGAQAIAHVPGEEEDGG